MKGLLSAVFILSLFVSAGVFLEAEEYTLIYGIVVDTMDNVIGDVKVELLKREGNEEKLVQVTKSRGKISPFYDGMFIFKGLTGGVYTLRLSKEGYEEVSLGFELKTGEILFRRIVMKEKRIEYGKIFGKVMVKAVSLEGIVVEIYGENSEKVLMSQETNAKGEFSFDKVEPAKYRVVLRYKNKELGREDVEVGKRQSVRKEFRLPDEALELFFGEIEGSVKDEEGKPVRGAVVEIVKAPEGQELKKTTTDSSGNFSISMLKPGTYRVKASLANMEPEENSTTVTAGRKKSLNFRLRKKK
ncbi:MAG: carboxypeptidase-like regulatory domain-containing protein [Planctomycetota bacterium]|nr:carboxypeptidase-like regulatory domain-containing protein [Planctomycetota bacterium]